MLAAAPRPFEPRRLTQFYRSDRLPNVRPWDKHPPWAHWAFCVIWVIAGSLGPIALIVGLLNGSTTSLLIGIGFCSLWGLSLTVDWLLVRWLQQHLNGWTPWRPPK